jgi:NAD(P)-dependent dehydrogenase (short-subunit alcohol dehydrogenase family)
MGVLRFPGKLAAVTGGGRGLGRALVRALVAEGAEVAFSYNESRADATREAQALSEAGHRVVAIAADARRSGEMAGFVEQAGRALGGLDILVNNSGVFRAAPLEVVSEEILDEAFDVNVKAAVLTSRAAAPWMQARGGGVIVNIASLGGLRAWKAYLPYCTTKAALIMATRCLALALAPTIRVNAVAPGYLDEPQPPAEALLKRVPLARAGRYADVVEAVLFLAGRAAYTTGEVLTVDGGRAWT